MSLSEMAYIVRSARQMCGDTNYSRFTRESAAKWLFLMLDSYEFGNEEVRRIGQ